MNKPTDLRKPKQSLECLKIFIYGPTGAGKTWLIGTATNDRTTFGKILILALDPGDLTLDHPDIVSENVDIAPIRSINDLEKWFDWLDTENVKSKEYGTVVIEGVTDVCELAMQEALETAKKSDPKRDRYLPTVELWNKVQIIARNVIRQYRDLPMHVIITALDMEKKDDTTGKNYIRPSVVGKLVNELGAYFDIVGYLSVDIDNAKDFAKKGQDVPRLLQLQPSEKIQAKDRSRRLGVTIENPTLPILIHLLKTNTERVPAPTIDATIKIKKPNIK